MVVVFLRTEEPEDAAVGNGEVDPVQGHHGRRNRRYSLRRPVSSITATPTV
jgi:hypothetical protein